MGQPTGPGLQSPVPQGASSPPDPVIPEPPEQPGTMPPGDLPTPNFSP